MSLLPGQIIPASMPIGKLSPDGKSVLIDENWWLFLYNIYLNSVNADVAGGFLKSFNGRTVSAAVPTTGDYKLSMLSDVSPDSWNDRDVLAYSSALAKWTASPQSEMTIVIETDNGFSGTVLQADNEQQITLTTTVSGMLKGDGSAISEANAGTDYSAGTSALGTGILKTTTGTGALSVAVAADFPTLNQNTTGSSASLSPGAEINGVNFTGASGITVTAAAGTLTGTTLATGVTASSLTSVGTLSSLAVTNGASAADFSASGLTGATKASRYAGATASGAPTSGTFALGDFVIDQTATIWICTVAGTPGTWIQVTASNAATVTTNADLTGPVTSTGNATAVTANAITNAMLAQSPAMTVKGNNTAATANAIDLTAGQVTAMLDPYSGSAQGLVPAGTSSTTNYLREDGAWAAPSSSSVAWGDITGTLSNQTDLVNEFSLYGALAASNTWAASQTVTGDISAIGYTITSTSITADGGSTNWGSLTASTTQSTGRSTLALNTGSASTTHPSYNETLYYTSPSSMYASWYDGNVDPIAWSTTYNGAAPTFNTYKNILDDGTGSATFANTISAIGASFVNGSSEADIYFGPEGSSLFSDSTRALGAYYPATASILFSVDYSGNMTVTGHITGPTPTLSSITITSGTVYQNTSGRWMTIYISENPASPDILTGGTGPTSTVIHNMLQTAITGATGSLTLRVPPGWYYVFDFASATYAAYALYEN